MVLHIAEFLSFLNLKNIPFYTNTHTHTHTHTHTPHFAYPFIHEWILGFFRILATVNNAAVNISIQIPVQDLAFNSLSTHQKWNCWIICNCVFNFLRNGCTVFHNGCTILHSYQQCTSVLISPHPCQHLFGFFFNSSYPNGCEAAPQCSISLMISDVEHFFMCLLVICISSLEKYWITFFLTTACFFVFQTS